MINKLKRISALMLIDTALIIFALYIALLLRFDGISNIPSAHIKSAYMMAPLFTVTLIATFYFTGLYNRLWKYASIGELLVVITAVSMGTVIAIAAVYFINAGNVQFARGVFILHWLLNIFLIGGSRLGWRLLRDYGINNGKVNGGRPVLVFGAGDAGVMVTKELKNHYNGQINLVGFIDDDPSKKNMQILGNPVLGSRADIPGIVEQFGVQEIILAMPSAQGKAIREIVEVCYKIGVKVRTVPGMYDLIEGNVTVNQIRDVQVEDLLGREPVKVDLESISHYIEGEVVLVTGAGGSIGS